MTAKTKPSRPAKSIDAYIAAARPAVRPILRKLRRTIREAAPDAEEVISYRIPAFRMKRIVVYFAAFEHHIGLYPPVKGDAGLVRAAKRWMGPKGNLIFPLDEPIPYSLVARIVRQRVKSQQRTPK